MFMYSLTMVRGKRSAFIGLFPSQYRVRVVHCNLEWCESWKPIIVKVRADIKQKIEGLYPSEIGEERHEETRKP